MAGSPAAEQQGPARVEVFGIRHHGPGSARSLVAALAEYEPDTILIEGPADADPLITTGQSAIRGKPDRFTSGARL